MAIIEGIAIAVIHLLTIFVLEAFNDPCILTRYLTRQNSPMLQRKKIWCPLTKQHATSAGTQALLPPLDHSELALKRGMRENPDAVMRAYNFCGSDSHISGQGSDVVWVGGPGAWSSTYGSGSGPWGR